MSGASSELLSFPPQVCLFFQNQLFRGNRTTKVDARRFAAFCSPNLPALATVGADITSKGIWKQGPLPGSEKGGPGVLCRGEKPL